MLLRSGIWGKAVIPEEIFFFLIFPSVLGCGPVISGEEFPGEAGFFFWWGELLILDNA